MNYQDKRKECKQLNIIVPSKIETSPGYLNRDTQRLVDLYYDKKEDFIEAYHNFKKQDELKNSSKRLDKIKFCESIYYKSAAVFVSLKPVLRALEDTLNIKPYKSVDSYEL